MTKGVRGTDKEGEGRKILEEEEKREEEKRRSGKKEGREYG